MNNIIMVLSNRQFYIAILSFPDEEDRDCLCVAVISVMRAEGVGKG
jgi:hypothetical protein